MEKAYEGCLQKEMVTAMCGGRVGMIAGEPRTNLNPPPPLN